MMRNIICLLPTKQILGLSRPVKIKKLQWEKQKDVSNEMHGGEENFNFTNASIVFEDILYV